MRAACALSPPPWCPLLGIRASSGHRPVPGHRCWCQGSIRGYLLCSGSVPPRGREPRAALTHLHVLGREACEGLQRVVLLVALPPLHVRVMVGGTLASQPQVPDELLHFPEGDTAASLQPRVRHPQAGSPVLGAGTPPGPPSRTSWAVHRPPPRGRVKGHRLVFDIRKQVQGGPRGQGSAMPTQTPWALRGRGVRRIIANALILGRPAALEAYRDTLLEGQEAGPRGALAAKPRGPAHESEGTCQDPSPRPPWGGCALPPLLSSPPTPSPLPAPCPGPGPTSRAPPTTMGAFRGPQGLPPTPLCSHPRLDVTHGMPISNRLFWMSCLPSMIMLSWIQSSIRQPPGAHCGTEGRCVTATPARRGPQREDRSPPQRGELSPAAVGHVCSPQMQVSVLTPRTTERGLGWERVFADVTELRRGHPGARGP